MDLIRPVLLTLRDIEDDHLGLYRQIRRFEELTGRRLTEPVIVCVGPDRYPSAYPGVRDRDAERWWPTGCCTCRTNTTVNRCTGHGRT